MSGGQESAPNHSEMVMHQQLAANGISNERLYLLLYDLRQDFEALKVRHDAMENFIKDQYPQHFAGEAETKPDPDLNPVSFETPNVERADPATCKHVASTRRYPAWDESKEGIDYCDACGAVVQPKKDKPNATG